MNIAKRCIASLLLITVVIAVFVGCGKGPEKSSNETGGDTPPATTESKNEEKKEEKSSGEKIPLRFSWWGGEERHEATLEAISLFEAANPTIVIDAEYSGYDGYQQKMITQLAGGTEPDIMQLDQPWMVEFSLQNPDFFVNMQEQDIVDYSNFSQDMLDDFCTYNGQLVGLPTGTAGMVLLVNQPVLDEAGVSFGDSITWDDLLNEGKKVKQENPEKYMLNMNNGSISYFIARIYLYQLNGGPYVNDDYTLHFTKEELHEALSYAKTLLDEKVLNPYEDMMLFSEEATLNPKWDDNYFGGALVWSSTANVQTWGDNAQIIPYPQMENAKQSGYIVRPSQILSVSNGSDHVEEALSFVDFFFNNNDAILALRDTRSIPATSHARALLEEEGLADKISIQAVNVSLEDPGLPESALSTNSEVLAPLEQAIEKMMYDQITVEQAVEEVFVLTEDVLSNLKESRD